MAEKKRFDTRILLKYDSLSNWNSSSLILEAGEVAIATVPTTETVTKNADGVITPPAAIVFKVGDGEHTFKDLPLTSGLAADVHGWAKKDENEFISWLEDKNKFALKSGLDNLSAEVSAIDAAYKKADKELSDLIDSITGGTGDIEGLGALSARITDLETVLTSFMGEDENGNVTTDAVKAAIEAVATSVSTLSGTVSGISEEVEEVKATQTEQGTQISTISGKVETLEGEMDAVEGDIATIKANIGAVPEGSNLIGMLDAAAAAAKKYTDDEVAEVAGSVSELAGLVSGNTDAIAVLNGTGDGSVSRKVADAIAEVVANAPEDFNTLKEIADWIASDVEGSAKLQTTVSGHTESIASLLAEDAVIKKSISDLDADLQGQIDAINDEETGILAVLNPKVKANEDAIKALQAADVTHGNDIANLKAKDTELAGLIGEHTTKLGTLEQAIATEKERAESAESTLLQAIEAEVERATAAEGVNATAISELNAAIEGLHKVASTGYINDLEQTEEIFFDCGTSAVRSYNA